MTSDFAPFGIACAFIAGFIMILYGSAMAAAVDNILVFYVNIPISLIVAGLMCSTFLKLDKESCSQ